MKRVLVKDLKPGMYLGRPLKDDNGVVLLNTNVELTADYIRAIEERGYWTVYAYDDERGFELPPYEILGSRTRAEAAKTMGSMYREVADGVEEFRGLTLDTVLRRTSERKFNQAFSKGHFFDRLLPTVTSLLNDAMRVDIMAGLYEIKRADSFLYDHSIDVTVTALIIGKLVGLNTGRLRDLATGCLVHDIGFVLLDESLIGYGDGLIGEQRRAYRQHTVLGYNLLRNERNIMYPHVAYQHHEWQDGSGYPRGLRGSNRLQRWRVANRPTGTLIGEICAVADFFDMLNTDTRMRPALPPDEAVSRLRAAAGSRLNTALVRNLLAVVPPYPIGTQVTVRGGRFDGFSGVVRDVDRDHLDRPRLVLARDSRRHKIEPVEYDLAAEGKHVALRVIWS